MPTIILLQKNAMGIKTKPSTKLHGGLCILLLGAVYFAAGLWRKDVGKRIENGVGGGLAIIVLGGGLNEDGTPPSWQRERCRLAAILYHKIKESRGTAPRVITLSGGTPWKPPPRDARGFSITEAAASARYLATELEPANNRVPYDDIMEEGFSLDTIGNAYFLRVMHTDPGRLDSLAIVTNEFHMPRSRAIFQWVFSLPLKIGGSSTNYALTFHTASNTGMDAATVKLREQKEMASLQNLPKTIGGVQSLEMLHHFIFDKHRAYGTFRHKERETEIIDPKVLATY